MTSVLLIFGSSNVGKSTLAARIQAALGWNVQSTDGIARHPGRPWPEVRDQVAEYYSSLNDETIYWFLRVHHENMWPHIQHLIAAALDGRAGVVLEGSALRPEYVAEMSHSHLSAIGLYADEQFITARIKAKSQYSQLNPARQMLIDKFLNRTLRDNAEVFESASRLGLPLINVANSEQLDWFVENLKLQNQL